MAKLLIKGSEPMEISKQVAQIINSYFIDPKVAKDFVISTDEWTGRKSEIKSVLLDRNVVRRNFVQENQELYGKGRAERLAMSPEERAEKSIDYFSFLYFGLTGSVEVPEELFEEAKKLMVPWFTEHLKRMWPDPAIFRPLFPNNNDINSKVFEIFHNVVSQDARDAEEVKEEPSEVDSLQELAEQTK